MKLKLLNARWTNKQMNEWHKLIEKGIFQKMSRDNLFIPRVYSVHISGKIVAVTQPDTSFAD